MDSNKFRQIISEYAQITSAQADQDLDEIDTDHAIAIQKYHAGQYPCRYCDRMLSSPPRQVLAWRNNRWVEKCIPCQNTVEKTDQGYQFKPATGRKKTQNNFVDTDEWTRTGGTEKL